MKVRFWKMSGAGNDFVLMTRSRPSRSLMNRICDRRNGVGADGVLWPSRRGRELALRYFNADGSEAFCGNGCRCAAWWFYRNGMTGGRKRFFFKTPDGPIEARIMGFESVAIRMPDPSRARLNLNIRLGGKKFRAHFIDTGVPHAVIETGSLETLPIADLGPRLRRHQAFGPGGANVDFVRFNGKSARLRTYERGVEAETLACGTGAAATALIGSLLGRCRSPVAVAVAGGRTLTVSFSRRGDRFDDVWLRGPAEMIFNGEIDL